MHSVVLHFMTWPHTFHPSALHRSIHLSIQCSPYDRHIWLSLSLSLSRCLFHSPKRYKMTTREISFCRQSTIFPLLREHVLFHIPLSMYLSLLFFSFFFFFNLVFRRCNRLILCAIVILSKLGRFRSTRWLNVASSIVRPGGDRFLRLTLGAFRILIENKGIEPIFLDGSLRYL